MTRSPWGPGLLALLTVSGLGACREESGGADVVSPAPPTDSRASDPCAEAAQRAEPGFPPRIGGYCVDGRVDVRRWGGATRGSGGGCRELWGDDCERHKAWGLESMRSFEYVTSSLPERRVLVLVSEFTRPRGAFGFFSQTVLGGAHPRDTPFTEIEARGKAALGESRAYLWRGRRVVELRYVAEGETARERSEGSAAALRPLVVAISEGIGGSPELPEEARLLDDPGLWPFGLEIREDHLLDVSGSGPGVLGFYGGPGAPHRVFLAARRDEAGAKDLLRLLTTRHRSKSRKDEAYSEIRKTVEDQRPETWYVAREGRFVLGVGPDDSTNATGSPLGREGLRRLDELRRRVRAAKLVTE